jgi:hypothetical protein
MACRCRHDAGDDMIDPEVMIAAGVRKCSDQEKARRAVPITLQHQLQSSTTSLHAQSSSQLRDCCDSGHTRFRK